MNFITRKEKLLLAAGFLILVAVSMFASCEPTRRYRLPNGDVVECRCMEETSKGNFHLYDCKDGTEYFIAGTLEALGG